MSLQNPSSAASLHSVPECTAECLLSAAPASVRDARSLVRRELSLWGAEDLIDDCVLIVSELVTNAIRYGGACALRLHGDGDLVYGEIFDPGTDAPLMCARDMESTGGRGLRIVDYLADDWGVVTSPSGGKTVWFVLSLPVPARPRPTGLPALI